MDPDQSAHESFHDVPSHDFARSLLPHYNGPSVKICIGDESNVYFLSKPLICEQSPFFAKTFNGSFQEGQEQSATLEEIEDVVTVRSFEALLQWLYTGNVNLGIQEPEEAIGTLIEFARIADMLGVTGMESHAAAKIKDILKANRAPWPERVDCNTYKLTSRHVTSAIHLPNKHAVRSTLANVAVRGFIEHDNHKFAKEAGETAFGNDLLMAVKRILKDVQVEDYSAKVEDPITNELIKLKR